MGLAAIMRGSGVTYEQLAVVALTVDAGAPVNWDQARTNAAATAPYFLAGWTFSAPSAAMLLTYDWGAAQDGSGGVIANDLYQQFVAIAATHPPTVMLPVPILLLTGVGLAVRSGTAGGAETLNVHPIIALGI